MPGEAAAIAAIGASSGLLSTGGQMLQTAKLNKKNRKFQNEQNDKNWKRSVDAYDWTRKHNLENWNLQNEYNSPKQQMARLKEAGLNPQLAYGNGVESSAGSVASNNAPKSDGDAPKYETHGSSDAFQTLGNIVSQIVQTDNLRAQTDLKQLQYEVDDLNLSQGKLDYSKRNELFDYEMSAKKAEYQKPQLENTKTQTETEKLKADTKFTNDENVRQEKELKIKTKQAIEQLSLTKEQKNLLIVDIANGKLDGTIKAYEAKLAKLNVGKNDPAYHRYIAGWLSDAYNFLTEPNTPPKK